MIGVQAWRAKVLTMYGALLACTSIAWLAAADAFGERPALLGMAGLAYLLGLRHAVDADHIAAIDNATRRLMQAGQRPISVGPYFSLGHSTVVLLASIVAAVGAVAATTTLRRFSALGSVRMAVSAGFLLGIALLNVGVLWTTYRRLRQVRAGGVAQGEALPAPSPGPLARLFSSVLRLEPLRACTQAVCLYSSLCYRFRNPTIPVNASALEAPHMARTRKNALPKYVELNPRNQAYY